MSTKAIVAMFAGAMFLVFVASCAQERSGNDIVNLPAFRRTEPNIGPTVIDARWPYWPVRMRIHPLTMATTDRATRRRLIEARVEMLDQFGDTTKCVAQFRFELHDAAPSSNASPARVTWNVDIRDPQQNRIHYDRVTRTYLFKLGLDDDFTISDDAHLRVFVLSVNGRQFIDIMPVR